MANQITGKIIAISDVQTIKSSDANKQPFEKRQLFLDCTRYDPYTGERGFENTPLLEFGGKSLEKLEELVAQGLKKDDIVTISFDIQGSKYTKDGKTQIFTRVRPYDIEVFKPHSQNNEPQHDAVQTPTPAPEPAPAPAAYTDNGLPF